MTNRMAISLGGFVSSAIIFAIYFTNRYYLMGILIGFLTGLINIQWLNRDSRKALSKELKGALRTYYLSLFSRLGMITMVVVSVAKFKTEWLLYLAGGIAAGIIIPLIIAVWKHYLTEGGDQ